MPALSLAKRSDDRYIHRMHVPFSLYLCRASGRVLVVPFLSAYVTRPGGHEVTIHYGISRDWAVSAHTAAQGSRGVCDIQHGRSRIRQCHHVTFVRDAVPAAGSAAGDWRC